MECEGNQVVFEATNPRCVVVVCAALQIVLYTPKLMYFEYVLPQIIDYSLIFALSVKNDF